MTQSQQETWDAVDDFFSGSLVPSDAALDAALADSVAAGLPQIAVAPNQGKFLHLLARIQGARRILEIGTLGGYSAIWLARALPEGGKLVSLEFNPEYAKVAEANIARAGLADKVEIRVGRALDNLPGVEADGLGPFDLSFIDANKENNPEYFSWAVKLSRVGALVITDNVVRDGAVLDADSQSAAIQGTRRLFEVMAADPRVTATAVQTVGSKGYDGFAMALVTGE